MPGFRRVLGQRQTDQSLGWGSIWNCRTKRLDSVLHGCWRWETVLIWVDFGCARGTGFGPGFVCSRCSKGNCISVYFQMPFPCTELWGARAIAFRRNVFIMSAASTNVVGRMQLFPRSQKLQLHHHMAKKREVDQEQLAATCLRAPRTCSLYIHNSCTTPHFFPERSG